MQHDYAVIELFIDKVHGAAGHLNPVRQGLRLSVEAGECGQQGRVDIENAQREGAHKVRGQQAHVAGEADQIHLVRLEAGDDLGVMLGAESSAGLNHFSGKARIARDGDSLRVAAIGNDNSDCGIGQVAFCDGAGNGEKIRSPARKQNPQAVQPGRKFAHA